MQQQEDADADAEVRRNMWKRKRLIPIDGKQRWDTWILFLAAYSAFELPMLWAFTIKPHTAHLVSVETAT